MYIKDVSSFGEALRKRRRELNIKQSDIFEKTGLSVSFISQLENGKATAEIGKALQVAEFLGLTIEIRAKDQSFC